MHMAKTKNLTSITPEDNFRILKLPTRFNTSANYEFDFDNPGYSEHLDPVSETVPDQCFSVQELLQRHLSGSLPPLKEYSQYDTDFEDLENEQDLDPLQLSPLDLLDFDLADACSLEDNLRSSQRHSKSSSRSSSSSLSKDSSLDGDTAAADIPQETFPSSSGSTN